MARVHVLSTPTAPFALFKQSCSSPLQCFTTPRQFFRAPALINAITVRVDLDVTLPTLEKHMYEVLDSRATAGIFRQRRSRHLSSSTNHITNSVNHQFFITKLYSILPPSTYTIVQLSLPLVVIVSTEGGTIEALKCIKVPPLES